MPDCQWPITAISYDRVFGRIFIKLCTRNHLLTLWEGDLQRFKVYEGSVSFVE